jgi:Transposase IS200 like
MDVHESLSHTKWDCKYHVVFIPMPDHVHMMISIPPKYAVSQVVGFIKGKSAIHLARSVRREDTEFRRSTFLGPWILRVDRGAGRADDTGVHQEPRKGRSAPGPAEYVALTATFRWPNA